MDEKISKIRNAVHEEFHFEDYNSTNVRDNTCCYSHAIGSTLPFKEFYRIGAISGRKGIKEEYRSEQEIEDLLCSDLEFLNLDIEKVNQEEIIFNELNENQYYIKLYLKIYRGNIISDYHFIRGDKGGIWSEKWWGQNVTILNNLNLSRYKGFPWKYVATFKISK